MTTSRDNHWLQHAIKLAQRAEAEGEVPVGAVLVLNDEVVAEGWNRPISKSDPTAHAEIVALREAAQRFGNYRLLDSTLYVTIEPCVMCVGAMVHARVKRLVYGADDPKAGAVRSAFKILQSDQFNHRVEYDCGILAEECGGLLSEFFAKRR